MLAVAAAKTFGVLLLGGYLYISTASSSAQSVVLLAMIAVHVWFLWKVARWYIDRFILSDKRLMMVTGIIARRVAMMPLSKLTDLSYQRSTLGVLLGYGTFVVESAGQDQPLSRIDYLPNPDTLFREVSSLLFGPPGVPPTPGRRTVLHTGPHGSFG
jgi:uncharacterized membrane protein YdbT with pleckstrin-like domain